MSQRDVAFATLHARVKRANTPVPVAHPHHFRVCGTQQQIRAVPGCCSQVVVFDKKTSYCYCCIE